jgi:hypothetical protein
MRVTWLGERSLTALALLLAGLALLLSTRGTAFADLGGAFSPTFFPRLVLMAWVALAALSLIAELARPQPGRAARLGRTAVMAAGLAIYVWAIPLLGFFLASAAFCAFSLILLEVRAPLAVVALSLGLPGALVGLFNHVLTLPLPVSPFVWWL